MVGSRTVGNYLREFVVRNPNEAITGETSLKEVAEELRKFFMHLYATVVIPAVEQYQKKPLDQIPEAARPGFGFVIGGFSAKAYLSEVWLVLIPVLAEPKLVRAQGDFNANWWALYEPIDRYLKGYSRQLMDELLSLFEKWRGQALSKEERQEIDALLAKHEFVIPTGAMPMRVGAEYTRFLVELVVNHHRYAIGAPVVGGREKIGRVSYTGAKFEILN